jgi:hypothetical protein
MMNSRQEKVLRSLIREELTRIDEAFDPYLAISLISMIPSLAMISDKRLKSDIAPVKKSPAGINIYEFSFKPGGQRYRGVMAQEIVDTHPDAVVINDDGFYAVRYSQIDVDFELVPSEEY